MTKVKAYSIKGRDGQTYYLHAMPIQAYWFSKKIGKHAIEEKPKDRKVKKNTRSGLPFLVRV